MKKTLGGDEHLDFLDETLERGELLECIHKSSATP